MQLQNLLPVALLALGGIGTASGKVYKAQLNKVPNSNVSPLAEEASLGPGHDTSLYFERSNYYINVTLGTPPQNFRVLIDTMRSDLWVPSTECYGQCQVLSQYDHNASSTYKSNGTSYDTFWYACLMKGYISQDTFNMAGLTIQRQDFAELETMVGPAFEGIGYDGWLGLGFPSKALVGAVPPFQMALDQGLLDEAKFGIYFGEDVRDSKNIGEITFGGVDYSKFEGDITWVPLYSHEDWMAEYHKVHFYGKDFPLANHFVTFDVRYPYIEVEQSVALELYEELDLRDDMTVDCAKVPTLPEVTFTFGGKSVTLAPEDYIRKESSGKCRCVILPSNQIEPGIGGISRVGFSFFKKFYSIFDFENKAIGIALAV